MYCLGHFENMIFKYIKTTIPEDCFTYTIEDKSEYTIVSLYMLENPYFNFYDLEYCMELDKELSSIHRFECTLVFKEKYENKN